MDQKTIINALSKNTEWSERRIIYMESTPSTQDIARAEAEKGAPEGTLVITDDQTGGRGRNKRDWFCPPGQNIAMSIVLRPSLPLDLAPMITLAAGLSIARGIAGALPYKTGDKVLIKWPNDVVIDRKKVSGVLVETFPSADGASYFSVVGIGINVLQKNFSPEIKDIAGSIFTQTGCRAQRERIVDGICLSLMHNLSLIEAAGSLEPIKEAYERRLVNLDKAVKVLDPSGDYEGTARGINAKNGALIVEPAGGLGIKEINSGEVSVRGFYGYV